MKTLHISIIVGIALLVIGNSNLSFGQEGGINFGLGATYRIFDAPLKQFRAGIMPENISCNTGSFLAIISHDQEPACLKAGTISKLASRGFFNGISVNENETNYTTILIPPGSEDQASNNTYSPNVATVVLGVNNTVRWVNQADVGNSLAADKSFEQGGKQFGSSSLRQGESYEFTFTEPGTFAYHGQPHPWQRGIIIVVPNQNNLEIPVKPSVTNQIHYYASSNLKPSVVLYDYFYNEIGNDGIVTIQNQTYYQTTLDYDIYNLPKDTPIQFHNVTFSFPQGTLITPGGAFVTLDVKFQDGNEEIYGGTKTNPDGSGMGGGISVPTMYGPHMATNSTTVLGNHTLPQAGITIYNDKIKLLVSTDADSDTQTKMSNSSSPLKLYLSTSSQTIHPGQAIGIIISVNNTLSKPITLSDENSWKLGDLSINPCMSAPYGIAMFNGFYSEQNVTEGKPLGIFSNDALCPVYNKTAQNYVFQPSSGHVTGNDCTNTECSTGFDMGAQFSFSGVWNYGQIQPFSPGLYTIVGGDEWGHVAIEHFVVSNSTIFAGNLGPTYCPLMHGGVQFGATIKNSTGFANYYNSTQYGYTFFLHPGMQGTANVQYTSPADAAWFENNGNAPLNMTSGAALFYMENVTEDKSIVSYAVSLYNDETGHHSQICHYNLSAGGGFMEPCDSDNTGDISSGELPFASNVLHVGIDTGVKPSFVMLSPNTSPTFTGTVSAKSDAMPGVYWLSLERSLCDHGVLAKLVVLR